MFLVFTLSVTYQYRSPRWPQASNVHAGEFIPVNMRAAGGQAIIGDIVETSNNRGQSYLNNVFQKN